MMPLWQSLIAVPVVFGGGACVLLGILVAVENPVASAFASALGCYSVCAAAVVVAWAAGAVWRGWDERPPSWVAYATLMFVVPGLLAWGLYHLLHGVVASRGVILVSEGVGCFVAFAVAFCLSCAVAEWRPGLGRHPHP
jgi:hypothetical protein